MIPTFAHLRIFKSIFRERNSRQRYSQVSTSPEKETGLEWFKSID